MRSETPKLDLKVRILFEEDLHTLIFPKVKELLFRVSRSSPLELAAKALARKNEHSLKWRDYSFTLMRAGKDRESQGEVLFKDLAVTFNNLLAKKFDEKNESESNADDKALQDELVLFYRVKDLQAHAFEGNKI